MIGRIALDLQKDSNYERRLKTAIQLAQTHKAELVGVYTTRLQQRYIFDDVSVPSQVRTIMGTYLQEEKDEMQGVFLETTRQAGVTAHWRAPEGAPDEALIMQARYADLIVMSQTENRQTVGNMLPNHTEAVIMQAGRPVLMVPFAGEVLPFLGKRVLFCWDYGRRAARALADAHPILAQATEVIALTIDPDKEMLRVRGIEPDDLQAYCKSHGYPELREVYKRSSDNDIGNTILNTATDYGCDLIVMGAYNRNRMREWAFGGTSKTLLQSMTVPILFSH
jgi:nucleotide-binding universal stress UspA family protein